MGWLWLLGWIKLQVSCAKETYKRDAILQKRPTILSILLTVATPYGEMILASVKEANKWSVGFKYFHLHTCVEADWSQMCFF